MCRRARVTKAKKEGEKMKEISILLGLVLLLILALIFVVPRVQPLDKQTNHKKFQNIP